jgi:hypothetical protein
VKKRRVITNGKLPERNCPKCGYMVIKAVIYGQLSYECGQHWGPWDDAIKRPAVKTTSERSSPK